MWAILRAVTFLFCSYLVVAAVGLGLATYLDKGASKRIAVLFRVTAGLVITLGVLAVLARIFFDSMLLMPGRLVFFAYYSDVAYASPVLILVLCVAILALVVQIFRADIGKENAVARRARVLAVCLLILIPPLPYAVVEGQTLVYGKYFTALLRQMDQVDNEKCKVLTLSPRKAVVAVDDYHSTVHFLTKKDGRWQIERSVDVKGEYIPFVPPYPSLDW